MVGSGSLVLSALLLKSYGTHNKGHSTLIYVI